LERAFEETRIYANAHRGFGVRPTGRMESSDDPMDLTAVEVRSPISTVGQLASSSSPVSPPLRTTFRSQAPSGLALRTPSASGKCFRCGKPGHLKRDCPDPFRSRPEQQTVSRFCFVCGSPAHMAGHCPSRASGPLASPRSPRGFSDGAQQW